MTGRAHYRPTRRCDCPLNTMAGAGSNSLSSLFVPSWFIFWSTFSSLLHLKSYYIFSRFKSGTISCWRLFVLQKLGSVSLSHFNCNVSVRPRMVPEVLTKFLLMSNFSISWISISWGESGDFISIFYTMSNKLC